MSAPTFDHLLGALVFHTHTEIPATVMQDTRVNILALSAATVRFAVATDQPDLYGGYEVWFANGSNWYRFPARLYVWTAPDMGKYQDSEPNGYGAADITDKRLSNVSLGNNVDVKDGAIQFNSTSLQFQIYKSGAWRDVLIGISLSEASDGHLQHVPTGFVLTYDIFSGNSERVGLSGLPIVQQHNVSMGAYPNPQIVDGGNADMSQSGTMLDRLNRTIHQILVRRMTDAQRAALTADDTMEGELIYATDTKKLYVSDGAGTLTALN